MTDEPLITLGDNVELHEDGDGNAVLRNTYTDVEVRLSDFVDIVGGSLGSPTNPLPSVTAENTDTATLNTDVWVAPGDNLQDAIDEAASDSDVRNRGIVKLHSDGVYDLSGTTLPITLKEGVTLDLNASFIFPASDANRLFEFERNAIILGHGAEIDENNFTGSIFRVHNDIDETANRHRTGVYGFPTLRTTNADIVSLTQTDGSTIAGTYWELQLHNAHRVVTVSTGNAAGFINNNTFVLKGSVGGDGSTFNFTFFGDDGDIRGNEFYFPNLQVKTGSDRVFNLISDGMNHNYFGGNIADPQNANTLVRWGNGVGTFNTVALDTGYFQAGYSVDQNDGGQRGNLVKPLNYPALSPIDLSAWNPPDGVVWADDGTNTTSGNPELAIRSNSTWYTMGGDAI